MMYQILKCLTVGSLESDVNREIAKGWVPQGGVAVTNSDYYLQAMVKDDEIVPDNLEDL